MYEAIIHGAAFLALKGEVGAHLRSNSATETWKYYTERLYRFDQLYRLFGAAADVAEAQNWDVLKDLRSHVEDVYGNWYLAELGDLWTRQVETDVLPDWQLSEIINQYDFYRREVKPVLDADPDRRVVVIISDAFRYEAAHEIHVAFEEIVGGELLAAGPVDLREGQVLGFACEAGYMEKDQASEFAGGVAEAIALDRAKCLAHAFIHIRARVIGNDVAATRHEVDQPLEGGLYCL